MTEKDRKYWRDTIENCEKFMKPKYDLNKRLNDELNLQFTIEGMSEPQIVHISRFRPLLRHVIAATAFNYPHIFLSAEDEPYEHASRVLQRAANRAIRIMKPKDHVHQAIFASMMTGVGWLKFGYNPPGDDAIAPYVANDDMAEDFPFMSYVPFRNILIDPQTPPHKFSHSKYVIEKMWVPMQMMKREEVFDPADGTFKKRYKNLGDLQPTGKDTDGVLEDMGDKKADGEEDKAIEESRRLDEMVLLYEIHDRFNGKRITFAAGQEKEIEEMDHPLNRVTVNTVIDPISQEELVQSIEPGVGSLVEGGFPYHPLRFDVGDKFFNLPPIAYVEDIQNLIVESVSRRRDLLKRFRRIVLGAKREKQANENVGRDMEDAQEGEILWVEDPANFVPANFGAVPQDQILVEKDALAYESQVAGVTDFGFSPSNRTATEMALKASSGQLNREWLLSKVAECYEVITKNTLSIMSDKRYTPDDFMVNFAPDGSPVLQEALKSEHFLVDFELTIRADSMQPLTEEVDRDQVLAMAGQLRGSPNINQVELDKRIIRAFREPNVDSLLNETANADAVKAAQLENLMMTQGQATQVTIGENHKTHADIHAKIEEMEQFQQMLPAQQQQILQLRDQHLQMHQEAEGQEVVPKSPGRPSEKSGKGPQGIVSQVQSNAQKTEEATRTQAQQVSERR